MTVQVRDQQGWGERQLWRYRPPASHTSAGPIGRHFRFHLMQARNAQVCLPVVQALWRMWPAADGG